MIVLAPKNVQELADLTIEAFDLADRYGLFVLVLGDQLLAIASEQYTVPEPAERPRSSSSEGQWTGDAGTGCRRRDRRRFAALERVGRRWEQKSPRSSATNPAVRALRRRRHTRMLIVAYGSLARIAEYSLPQYATVGIRVGVFVRSRCGPSLPKRCVWMRC